MKESERLIAAKQLIADKANWTQKRYADNIIHMDKATCFCSLGAVHMVRTGSVGYSDVNETAHYLQRAILQLAPQSFGDVVAFNDNNTHESVMEMFDLAIKLAQDEGN